MRAVFTKERGKADREDSKHRSEKRDGDSIGESANKSAALSGSNKPYKRLVSEAQTFSSLQLSRVNLLILRPLQAISPTLLCAHTGCSFRGKIIIARRVKVALQPINKVTKAGGSRHSRHDLCNANTHSRNSAASAATPTHTINPPNFLRPKSSLEPHHNHFREN